MASLLQRSELSAEQMEHVETIRSCGDALLSIIDDVLSFSKLETGVVEIEQMPFGLGRLVNSAVRVSLGAAQAKGLELTFELDADLPSFVRGDEKRLRQVLLNLLSNAVKFTPDGSVRLRVHGSENGGEPRLRFEVTDTGIGISDAAKDRLFKEFSQGDASINRRFGGTGLGLAICKRLTFRCAVSSGRAAPFGSRFRCTRRKPLRTRSKQPIRKIRKRGCGSWWSKTWR